MDDLLYGRFLESFDTTNRDLLFRFFIFFARFEYALKECGYTPRLDGRAEAGWTKFAEYLDNSSVFNRTRTKELSEAVDYLIMYPPRKQCIRGGTLSSESTTPDSSEIKWLLLLICRVRNNLFHGGKFRNVTAASHHRDFALIEHSLVVLEECLELQSNVKSHFLGEFA